MNFSQNRPSGLEENPFQSVNDGRWSLSSYKLPRNFWLSGTKKPWCRLAALVCEGFSDMSAV